MRFFILATVLLVTACGGTDSGNGGNGGSSGSASGGGKATGGGSAGAGGGTIGKFPGLGGGPAAGGGGSATGGGSAAGGGTAAGGGKAVGGGTAAGGGTGTGQHELTDGSLGSSCGACTGGLSCLSQAPNGYCSMNCTDSAQCPGGFCYGVNGVGNLCLRACTTDNDCRPGYTCQGQAGGTICYPAPTGTGGGTGTGTTSNASVNGCYWMNGDITYRYHFDGVGSFDDVSFTAVSGTITSSGAYAIQAGNITLQYSAGRTEQHSFALGTGTDVYIGGTRYVRSGSLCE